MPTRFQILRALLLFGAADAAEKARVLDEYQAHCEAMKGGPHVSNPPYEVVVALQSFARYCGDEPGFSERGKSLLQEIWDAIEQMLDAPESEFTDGSMFGSPLGERLSVVCREAMAELRLPDEEPLPFWDLMCYVCD